MRRRFATAAGTSARHDRADDRGVVPGLGDRLVLSGLSGVPAIEHDVARRRADALAFDHGSRGKPARRARECRVATI
jgi:hypothetical protein